MYLKVFTHALNVELFNNSESIIVSPTPNSVHDIEISVKLSKVKLNANSSALYLTRNLMIDKIRRYFRKKKKDREAKKGK